ncbi:alanine--glyoxylate aminotransferase 2 [Balamuthia mandrillaris]
MLKRAGTPSVVGRVAGVSSPSSLFQHARRLNSHANYSTGKALPELPPTTHTPERYTGPSLEEVTRQRKTYLSPALFHYYRKPVMVVEGRMQYLWDHTGKRYLDAIGGIVTVSVGHCHPKVVEAGAEQLRKLQHTTAIYYHPQQAAFAEELAEKMPGDLKVVYFTNSGSEANDLATLLARAHTGNFDMICLRNCYHGMSMNTMGITGLHTWKYNQPQGFGFHHALNPNTYRGPFGPDVPEVGKKYADDVKDLIQTATSGTIAGFICEPIQGVGGSVVPPDGYLKHVYKHVRDHKGVAIADEVQTGFGRLGTHYWGFQSHGVMPDIVTMAKGIGNGTPLAAVVTTPEIAKSLTQRIHFNTFGGNPVSCAMGRAVLKVIQEEGIQENALSIGDYLKKGLKELQGKHPLIGEVRGKGLMLGVELVKDRSTKEPAAAETANIFEKAKDMGLLLGKGGLFGNVFRIKPPMCLNKRDADFLLQVLDICFTEEEKAAK